MFASIDALLAGVVAAELAKFPAWVVMLRTRLRVVRESPLPLVEASTLADPPVADTLALALLPGKRSALSEAFCLFFPLALPADVDAFPDAFLFEFVACVEALALV